MEKRWQTPREFGLISEPPPIINKEEFPGFYTLYQRAIFISLERRGIISKAQRDAALTTIDQIPRKSGLA